MEGVKENSSADDKQLSPQAKTWLTNLNTTCNRLTSQYLSLLRSACNRSDENRSGGAMVRK